MLFGAKRIRFAVIYIGEKSSRESWRIQLVVLLIICSIFVAPALAGVTKQIAVQGMLTKGSIIFGTTVKFEIFNNSGGTGSPICTVTKNDIAAATDGIFTTLLDLSTCPSSLDFSTDYWIKITIGTGAGSELSPLQRLTPAPYALALPGLVSMNGKIGIGPLEKVGLTEPLQSVHIVVNNSGLLLQDIFNGAGTYLGGGMLHFLQEGMVQASGILEFNVAGSNPFMSFSIGADPALIIDKNKNVYTTSGNVGIGTASPGAKLEVNGSLIVNSGHAVTDANPDANVIASFINTGAPLSSGETRIFDITQTSSNNVMLRGVGRNIILEGGNVGIGTTDPSGALDVSGNAYFNKGRNGGGNHVTIRGLGVGQNYGVMAFTTYNGASDVNIASIAGVITGATAGSEAGGLSFGIKPTSGVITEGMRINPDGNVGIGTTTPSAKLDVKGSAMITGSISNPTVTPSGQIYETTLGGSCLSGDPIAETIQEAWVLCQDNGGTHPITVLSPGSGCPFGTTPTGTVTRTKYRCTSAALVEASVVIDDSLTVTGDLQAANNNWGDCYIATYGTPSGACDGHASCANGYFMKGFYLSQGNSVNCVKAECCKL